MAVLVYSTYERIATRRDLPESIAKYLVWSKRYRKSFGTVTAFGSKDSFHGDPSEVFWMLLSCDKDILYECQIVNCRQHGFLLFRLLEIQDA